MRPQLSQFLLVTSVFLLISGCATHGGYISPCVTNPDGDYKDLVTIVQKAECFSGDAIIEKPITKEILPMPTRTLSCAYSFNDLQDKERVLMVWLVSVLLLLWLPKHT